MMKILKILMIPSCGIVPVNQLTPEDTLLRCQEGLRLWEKKGGFDKLLLSGGIFLPKEIQTIPAAQLMANWFKKKCVFSEDILIEDQSIDTFENVRLSLFEIDQFIFQRCKFERFEITVCTQWQHAIRFWITFRFGHGVRVKLHPMRYPISWSTWLHEWAFILYHLWDPKGKKGLAQKKRAQRRQLLR